MKLFIILLITTFVAHAEDPATYLKLFDAKVYSLKSKGVKDFSVDLESTRLTKQINDQQSFGKVEELLFRVYWTAEPERVAVEVLGLPEGFIELKEELKLGVLQILDNLLPQTFQQKFNGYRFLQGTSSKEIVAQDTTGLAAVPNFVLKFDEQDRLSEVVGNKPVGSVQVKTVFDKTQFSDGKWVLEEQVSMTGDNIQTIKVTKSLDYEKSQGIGVLSEVTIDTEYVPVDKKTKPLKQSESFEFKNYKINEGVALNYFLGASKLNGTTKQK